MFGSRTPPSEAPTHQPVHSPQKLVFVHISWLPCADQRVHDRQLLGEATQQIGCRSLHLVEERLLGDITARKANQLCRASTPRVMSLEMLARDSNSSDHAQVT